MNTEKQITILAVDDSKTTLCMLSDYIHSNFQYNLVTCLGAKEALDVLQHEEINLIICDVYMPEMDGFEFARLLRADKRFSEIPFIFLSSLDDKNSIREAYSIGVADYLTKPMDFVILSNKISTILKPLEALIRERTLMKRMLNAINEGIILTDNNNNILFSNGKIANHPLCTHSNICQKECLKLSINDVENCSCTSEIEFDKKHYICYSSMIDENLKMVNWQDITNIKLAEHQLLINNRTASLGETVGNIAHQWRQPLSTIGLSVMNLKFAIKDKGEEIALILSQIEDQVQYLSSTIDDFMNFYRTDKDTTFFSFEDTVSTCTKLLKPLLENLNIDLKIDDSLTKNVGHLHGMTNEVSQVILNILKNSIDVLISRSIVNPKITIGLKVTPEQYVLLIEDNAGGIKNDIIDKVFDPYFTTKHQSQGTGIGLYMSKIIIENHHHNGKLSVTNSENGAVFSIALDKAEANTEAIFI